jgi:DNA modification methylase
VSESQRQFYRLNNREWKPSDDGVVECRDARRLGWLNEGSVDLVVTSPPYLGVNDYVRSMRLTSLLFPEEGGDEAISAEIGARRKRHRSMACEEYIQDIREVLSEISRVLKPKGYLALVIGQGRGRVNRGDMLERIVDILRLEHRFEVQFREVRKIKFRRIQVPGVGTECIYVFRR